MNMNKIIKDLNYINDPSSIHSKWSKVWEMIFEDESINSLFNIRSIDGKLLDRCDVLEEIEAFIMRFPAG